MFAYIRFLIKRFWVVIIPDSDIGDSIAIVVILDILHDVFEIIIASMLKSGDKIIKEIQ